MPDVIEALNRFLQAEPGIPVAQRPVLVVARAPDGPVHRRVRALGGCFETQAEIYTALASVIDDPAGWAGLVICCDDYGGLDEGLRAHRLLGDAASGMPVILVSAQCGGPRFPDRAGLPILLDLADDGEDRLAASHA